MPLKQSISLFDLDLLFLTTISLVYRSLDRILPHIGYTRSDRISSYSRLPIPSNIFLDSYSLSCSTAFCCTSGSRQTESQILLARLRTRTPLCLVADLLGYTLPKPVKPDQPGRCYQLDIHLAVVPCEHHDRPVHKGITSWTHLDPPRKQRRRTKVPFLSFTMI